MKKLVRETETPEERESRENAAKAAEAVALPESPAKASAVSAWLTGLLVVATLLGSVFLCFRIFEHIGYEEVVVMDCGSDDVRVERGKIGTVLPSYVGFCDVTTYHEDIKAEGRIRLTFSQHRTGMPKPRMGEVKYVVRAEMSGYALEVLDTHAFAQGLGGGEESLSRYLDMRTRTELTRLSKGDCDGDEQCIERELSDALSPEFFRRWGMRFKISFVKVYLP